MESIEKHFKLLLDRYELGYEYNKFKFISIFNTLSKESVYWIVLYFSTELGKNKGHLLNKYIYIVLGMIGVWVIMDRYHNYNKSIFNQKIKLANSNYYNNILSNLSIDKLIETDLVAYYKAIDDTNRDFDFFIENIKITYDIPIVCFTLLIISLNNNYSLIIIIFVIFCFIIKYLNEIKIKKESYIIDNINSNDVLIRNYIINSKNLLINDQFNENYINDKIIESERLDLMVQELNNKLFFKTNIGIFIIICAIIYFRLEKIDRFTFIYYFMIIYDIEWAASKINEYYTNKNYYNKMNARIQYLNKMIPFSNKIKRKKIDAITSITINKLYIKLPHLEITKPLTFTSGNHMLIEGVSGSGKTTLFYILKGIVKADSISITPNIMDINNQTFISLPNSKGLFSGKLYDIISNYEEDPDTELINDSLILSRFIYQTNTNPDIFIDKISAGEGIRLLIARIIYSIKKFDYSVLLFDEIDQNLNDDLAFEICNNIKEIFHDKIILYITHNEKVKKLFTKKITISDGHII
jgi:ABC-type lipoprotein export system ATPase subunit